MENKTIKNKVIEVVDENILWVQKTLNKLKVVNDKLTENGISNDQTIDAIKKFQSITHAETNGIVEQNTKYRINEIINKPILSIKSSPETFAVMFIQYIVGAKSTGIFDLETLEAIKEWQTKNELDASGVVDYNMWTNIMD